MRLALGFKRVGRLNERDDRAQLGLGRVGAHAHQDAAVLDDGTGKHVIAHAALDGQRLAGQGRLVDHGAPLLDHAIDADGHAGTHGDQVAGLKLGGGNAYLGVADHLLRFVGHIEQRVNELVFAHGAGVVLEQLTHIEQEHRLPRGIDVAFDKRDTDSRSVEHRNGQARLRELVESGAQKGHVAGNDKDGTQRRGQKPTARVVDADKRRQIHNQLVLARLKLHHVTRLGVGDGLSIERADGGQHGVAARLVVFERHLPDASVDAHLAHAVDFATEL